MNQYLTLRMTIIFVSLLCFAKKFRFRSPYILYTMAFIKNDPRYAIYMKNPRNVIGILSLHAILNDLDPRTRFLFEEHFRIVLRGKEGELMSVGEPPDTMDPEMLIHHALAVYFKAAISN